MNEEQRNRFKQQIIKLVTILNQVFSNNYIFVSETEGSSFTSKKIKKPLVEISESGKLIYTYEPLSNLFKFSKEDAEGQIKKTLFHKVCKNLILLYLEPEKKKQKTKPTLSLVDIKPIEPPKKIEIYSPQGEFVTEGYKPEICNEFQIQEYKEYMYLKLKLLIYINDVINFDMMDDKNKYEKLLLAFLSKNPQRGQEAAKTFLEWCKQIEQILEQVMNNEFNVPVLQRLIELFETTDPLTLDLCRKMVPLCDNAGQIDPNVVCNPDKINIHSVTQNVCSMEDALKDEIDALNEELSDFDNEIDDLIVNIPEDTSLFNDAVQSDISNLLAGRQDLEKKKSVIQSIQDPKQKKEALESLKQKTLDFADKVKNDPIIKVQDLVNQIDLNNIRDTKGLQNATKSIEGISKLLNQEKKIDFKREITDINRDLKFNPGTARNSLNSFFNSGIKPLFERKFDKDAVTKYYDNLEKQFKTERDITKEGKEGYKNWFSNLLNKSSKQPDAVKMDLEKQAGKRVETLKKEIKEAKTEDAKKKIVEKFKKKEKAEIKSIEVRKRILEILYSKLSPNEQKDLKNALLQVSNIREYDNLINSYISIAKNRQQPQVTPVPLPPVPLPPETTVPPQPIKPFGLEPVPIPPSPPVPVTPPVSAPIVPSPPPVSAPVIPSTPVIPTITPSTPVIPSPEVSVEIVSPTAENKNILDMIVDIYLDFKITQEELNDLLIQYREITNMQDLNQQQNRQNELQKTLEKLNQKNSQYYILYFDDPDTIYNQRLSKLIVENRIDENVISKIYEIRKQMVRIKNAIDQQQK